MSPMSEREAARIAVLADPCAAYISGLLREGLTWQEAVIAAAGDRLFSPREVERARGLLDAWRQARP